MVPMPGNRVPRAMRPMKFEIVRISESVVFEAGDIRRARNIGSRTRPGIPAIHSESLRI
jgi:hypothetical protein